MELITEIDIRKLAIEYLTPGGPRKVVRKPKTDHPETHRLISHNDGHLSVRSWGEGPLVMLVHGWAANQTDMFKYVSAFVENDYCAVAIDLPAHGESTGETASLDQLADGIVAVAEHFGNFKAVVAHSVGCAATQIALTRGLNVDKAIMLASPENYENAARRFAKYRGLEDDHLEIFIQELHDLGVRTAIKSLDVVGNFQLPALIIHSVDDPVIPIASSKNISEAWSGSRFVSVNQLGHRGVLKDDAVIQTVIDFVKE
ncbi:MAG: alpha/beta hydrolase [Leptolyngbya sp.]|nr:alpha/beta hydrolase [Candidatus Melainabacteria bacterium]